MWICVREGDPSVKKASEFRQHAVECRQLAAGVQDIQREQLLEMARTWDRLAEERSELVRRHPELNQQDERPRDAGETTARSVRA